MPEIIKEDPEMTCQKKGECYQFEFQVLSAPLPFPNVSLIDLFLKAK